MLEDKIKYHKETGELLNNTPKQYKDKYPFLNEVDNQLLNYESKQLFTHYGDYLKRKTTYISFKKKKQNQNYVTQYSKANGFIKDNHIKIRNVGNVKIKYHRLIPKNATPKTIRIKHTKSDKYYACIYVVFNEDIPQIKLSKDKALGLDYSSPYFYVDNQGRKAEYPKFYYKSEKYIIREQKKLSRMIPGSKNYEKQRIKFARKHERVVNQRKDWLNKLSTKLADQYDIICVENLDLVEISRHYNLGKATYDNAFGTFKMYLKYKLEERGKTLVQINRWFASSKMCHVCHNINVLLELSDRTWTCKRCNTTHDRDVNAAINILQEGIKFV